MSFVAHFQALIADNFGISALFQVLIADSLGILALLLQMLIAENFCILALFQVLIAKHFGTVHIFNTLGKNKHHPGLEPWHHFSLLYQLHHQFKETLLFKRETASNTGNVRQAT